MMKYTHEQQAAALHQAAKNMGIDAHVTTLDYKNQLQTWADKILGRFFRKGMPVKRSYLFCDCLDVDFFFHESGEAAFTYAGYADSRDLDGGSLEKAMKMAKAMRDEMQRVIEEGEANERG